MVSVKALIREQLKPATTFCICCKVFGDALITAAALIRVSKTGQSFLKLLISQRVHAESDLTELTIRLTL